jgi:putative ABC transport system substrate-binding protein
MGLLSRNMLITLLAVWTLAAPALAEVPPKPARLGFATFGPIDPNDNLILAGFREGMREKGYVLGHTLVLEERYAEGHIERLAALITELLTLNIDVLFTVSSQAAFAVKRATSTVPVVAVTGDPVGTGLVESLHRPGGNITGVSLLSGEYSSKWLELLKEMVPNLHRVAVLWNPENPTVARQKEKLQELAPGLGVELLALSGRPSEIDASLARMATATPDGLVVCDDGAFYTIAQRLILFASERRLPTISGLSNLVGRGGLMSYSANFFQVGRRAASQVDRILKGAHPSDLPIDQATDFSLHINLNAAKLLGRTISPSLLARADEVIE